MNTGIHLSLVNYLLTLKSTKNIKLKPPQWSVCSITHYIQHPDDEFSSASQ